MIWRTFCCQNSWGEVRLISYNEYNNDLKTPQMIGKSSLFHRKRYRRVGGAIAITYVSRLHFLMSLLWNVLFCAHKQLENFEHEPRRCVLSAFGPRPNRLKYTFWDFNSFHTVLASSLCLKEVRFGWAIIRLSYYYSFDGRWRRTDRRSIRDDGQEVKMISSQCRE